MGVESATAASRQARAIRLLTCLQGGMAFTAKELAQRLKVSQRTIYRDLSLIRHAGVDIQFDPQQCGYRLGGTSLGSLAASFAAGDVAKLALTANFSLLCASPQFRMSVRESLARLLVPFPMEVRQGVAHLLSCCDVELPRPQYPDRVLELVEVLLSAMARRRLVRLDLRGYGWQENVRQPIRLAPYHLVAGLADWWLYGRSWTHQRLVRLAVSRIGTINVLEESYQIPSNFRARLKTQELKLLCLT